MRDYFCILGGGGIRGAAYAGAIKALKELNINIKGWAGSSIGAVVAGLITFGYKPDEIDDVFKNIDFEIFKDINFKFGKDFALSRGDNFYEWIKNKIEVKFFKNNETKRPVTFRDVKEELVIFSCNLVTSKLYEFSKTKTPDVEVAHAIRVSVGMPGLYSPVCDECECLVDGDLVKSMPLWMASSTINERCEKIIEFRLENNETRKNISNTFEYLNAVYDSMTGIATDFLIEKYKDYEKCEFIKLNLEGVSVVDFMANNEKKQQMVNIGYDTTIDYFQNKYPVKDEYLKSVYKKILAEFKKIEFCITNKNFNEARFYSADIVAELVKDIEHLDNKVISTILNFKKLFEDNYIVKNGLFGKKPALIEYNQVLEEVKKIVSDIDKKFDV